MRARGVLSMDDDGADADDREPAREPAGIVGVALRNGRGFTASGDGRCRCWDAKSGEAIATWPSPSRFEPSPGFEPSPRFEPSSSPSQIDTNPATCMAHGDGIVVVGHEKNGLIRGFDVDAGVETLQSERRARHRCRRSRSAGVGSWPGRTGGGGRCPRWTAPTSSPAGDRVCRKSGVRSPAGWARAGFRGGPAPTRRLGSNAASPRAPSIRAVDSPPSPPAPRPCRGRVRRDFRRGRRRRTFIATPVLRRRVDAPGGSPETVRCVTFVPRPADGTCSGLGRGLGLGRGGSITPFLV